MGAILGQSLWMNLLCRVIDMLIQRAVHCMLSYNMFKISSFLRRPPTLPDQPDRTESRQAHYSATLQRMEASRASDLLPVRLPATGVIPEAISALDQCISGPPGCGRPEAWRLRRGRAPRWRCTLALAKAVLRVFFHACVVTSRLESFFSSASFLPHSRWTFQMLPEYRLSASGLRADVLPRSSIHCFTGVARWISISSRHHEDESVI